MGHSKSIKLIRIKFISISNERISFLHAYYVNYQSEEDVESVDIEYEIEYRRISPARIIDHFAVSANSLVAFADWKKFTP